jgi:hypothetical protein
LPVGMPGLSEMQIVRTALFVVLRAQPPWVNSPSKPDDPGFPGSFGFRAPLCMCSELSLCDTRARQTHGNVCPALRETLATIPTAPCRAVDLHRCRVTRWKDRSGEPLSGLTGSQGDPWSSFSRVDRVENRSAIGWRGGRVPKKAIIDRFLGGATRARGDDQRVKKRFLPVIDASHEKK